MSKQVNVISNKTYFIGGRRVRPGEVFTTVKVKPDMTVVDREPTVKPLDKPAAKPASKAKGQPKDPDTFSEIAKNEPAGADLV